MVVMFSDNAVLPVFLMYIVFIMLLLGVIVPQVMEPCLIVHSGFE